MGRSGSVDARQPAEIQQQVDAHFDAKTSLWKEIYARKDVYAVIHQHRQALTLALIDRLDLPAGTPALEVGCGAGLMTVALAQRGFQVEATDSSPAMVEATRGGVDAANLSSRVTATYADAHSLEFDDREFRLVVSLGVIPWLHSPLKALAEMARVLEPGGHLIVNADNRRRLNHLLDPVTTPVLSPLRKAVVWALERVGLRQRPPQAPLITMHTTTEFDRLISSLGLEKVSGTAFGFGPFMLARRKVMPDRAGVFVHRKLQQGSDRDFPGLRSTGSQYLVLARKPADGA
jgi:2-polyprenyl-3-methyl-5-hydroxy-6-metoxy-1,4-benzoquinol methylase